MKTSVILGRVVKVATVVVVTATITWQAQSEQKAANKQLEGLQTQQAGLMPQPWVKHRKEQMQELTRSMPNRFALSKAYYGTEDALLESAELERLKKSNDEVSISVPKS